MLVLTGFMAALSGDRVDFVDIKSEGQVNAGTELESGEEGYGYCTEFIVRLEPSLIDKFSENQLKKELERIPETVSSLYKMKISLKYTYIH